MSSMALNPAIITSIQHTFVSKLLGAFNLIGHYALALFFTLAAIELGLFGIAWAIRQDAGFGLFTLKVFKLGVILFVITAFPHLLQIFINGFTQIAFQVDSISTAKYIFNPAQLWQFGFNAGIQMLKLSVTYGTTNIGISNVYLFLGLGTLILFGLIGIQVLLAVVGFYLVSLVALLLMPFGAFFGTKSFLDAALKGVIQSGVRVFVVILVVGVGVAVWSQLNITISQTTPLDKPLSLCFSALIFLVLAKKLPQLAVNTVGELGGSILGDFPASPHVTVNAPGMSSQAVSSPISAVAAGSSLQATEAASSLSQAASLSSAISPHSVNLNISSGVNVSAGSGPSGLIGDIGQKNKASESASLQRRVSQEIPSKLKKGNLKN